MDVNDIKEAYNFINKRNVFTNITNPIIYVIPRIKGIHKGEYGKTIKDVYPSTLKYIIYNLHDINYDFLIESIIALFYYCKFRKNSNIMLNRVYEDIINHYTYKDIQPITKYEKGKSIYLIKIEIGSETLYKIGKTSDFNKRITNIKDDIESKYGYVSVRIEPLQVFYISNIDEVENEILSQIRSKKNVKHKFYFNGHTESFLDKCVIDIYNERIRNLE